MVKAETAPRARHTMRTALIVFFAMIASTPSVTAEEVVTLAQCVDQAMTAGPGILVSRAAVSQAAASYTQAVAANSFGLAGNASVSHTNTETNVVEDTATSTDPTDSLGAGVSLTAPLSTSVSLSMNHGITEETTPDSFTSVTAALTTTLWDGYAGGQGLATVRKQALSLRSTEATESATRRTVLSSVKKAYYTLLAQQGQCALAGETLAQRREELAKAETLYAAHDATLIDLRTARVNARTAELDLQLAEDTRETDRGSLSNLVGWPLTRQYTVAETGDPVSPALDVSALVVRALERRADLKALQASLASADIDLALARADMSPTVSTSEGMHMKYHWALGSSSLQWSATLNVSMPILDAGAGAAAVAKAMQARRSSAIQVEQLAATVTTDVMAAAATLRDRQGRVELAALSVELAQDEYDLARMQYESGTGTHLEMLTQSVALTTARVDLATAKSDAQLAALALDEAIGD